MPQIPTYVTSVPNGTEKVSLLGKACTIHSDLLEGLYMAVDLGGTNFRVCSIQLHGDTTFSLTQTKVPIPQDVMTAKTYRDLFSFLAKQIENFLKTHHNEHYMGHVERKGSHAEGFRVEEVFSLGFTFSFPVHQVGINRGTLIRWTKGFDIPDAVGKDVCSMLQVEIDLLHLPVTVVALVNDTVGTLMARSYASPGKSGTLLGAIFGTGTNGAYVEKLSRIRKLALMPEASDYDKSTGEMIINSEWGSFDNTLHVLPNTPIDAALDAESNNPGYHLFEKRVSGMYLGEILRRTIIRLHRDESLQARLFEDKTSAANDLHSTCSIAEDSPLWRPHGLDTSFLSLASADQSDGLRLTRQALNRELAVHAASAEDAEAVQILSTAIGKRAARLGAVAIGAVTIASGKLERPATGDPELDVIDVGVDGSLVEFYPGFEDHIRSGLREIEEIGVEGEKRIRIGIAKDGSGVGAALIALVAEKAGVGAPNKNLTVEPR